MHPRAPRRNHLVLVYGVIDVRKSQEKSDLGKFANVGAVKQNLLSPRLQAPSRRRCSRPFSIPFGYLAVAPAWPKSASWPKVASWQA